MIFRITLQNSILFSVLEQLILLIVTDRCMLKYHKQKDGNPAGIGQSSFYSHKDSGTGFSVLKRTKDNIKER